MLLTRLNDDTVTLHEPEYGRFQLMELRSRLDALLASGAVRPGDHVLFRDATSLWHEAVHDYGRSTGFRFLGAMTREGALRCAAPLHLTPWEDFT